MTAPRKVWKKRLQVAFLIVVALCAIDAIVIEPTWLKVEHVTLSVPRLPPAFDGYRLVQLTDFHYPRSLGEAYFRRVIAVANAQHPDLVVMTGDYICVQSRDAEGAARLIAGLHAPDGIIGVLGNHDFWTSSEHMARCLRANGVTVLRNDARAIRRKNGRASLTAPRLWIVGVDDVWEGKVDLAKALHGVPAAETKILLAHEPDFADTAKNHGIAVQLSGHSHGGLVWIPGLGAPRLPPYCRKYPHGLYTVGALHLYTSRGLGVIPVFNIPVRFNCRPEITVFTLRASPGRP
jgi:predicted MPP superfamily phosphohydrolase